MVGEAPGAQVIFISPAPSAGIHISYGGWYFRPNRLGALGVPDYYLGAAGLDEATVSDGLG